jgi:hypothetical protein
VKLYARVDPELRPTTVVLFYRTAGGEDFKEIKMRKVRSGAWLGVIPGREVRGRSIHYYMEAMDDTGDRLGGSGTAISPNIIICKRGRRVRRRRGRGVRPKPKPDKKSFSIGVMAGTGLGVVNGGESEHNQKQAKGTPRPVEIRPGGALTPFHIAPEFSYHINERWHVSVLGRIQVVNAVSQSSKISLLGEARAKRFFGGDSLRFYLAFGAGAGQIRHRIPLGDYDDDGNPATADPTPDSNDRIDTRVASIVCFGLGGGLVYMFSSYMGVVVELNGLILVPDFAANADLNAGIVLSF